RQFDATEEGDLFEEFVLQSAEGLLSRYVESDRLRGFMMFMGLVSTWGGPSTPGTAYVYGYHAQGEVEGHLKRYGLPAGGMGMIAQAMANSVTAHGGEIRLGQPVDRIIVRDGRAQGVVLRSGENIQTGIVVSNADPKLSLSRLLSA